MSESNIFSWDAVKSVELLPACVCVNCWQSIPAFNIFQVRHDAQVVHMVWCWRTWLCTTVTIIAAHISAACFQSLKDTQEGRFSDECFCWCAETVQISSKFISLLNPTQLPLHHPSIMLPTLYLLLTGVYPSTHILHKGREYTLDRPTVSCRANSHF